MTSHIDTLLLLALPASGKSELRRYLASLDDEVAARDFGLGPRVDLDDYPYVHLMRRIDEELDAMGEERVFYHSGEHPFRDGRDWATLINLVNEDYAALGSTQDAPNRPTAWFIDRLVAARRQAGIEPAVPARLTSNPDGLADGLDGEVAELAADRSKTLASFVPDRSTVVVEFARGGPEEASLPLEPPHGYAYSLAALSPDLLDRSVALYVWVTPEESRRRNRDRAKPGRDGDASILHHGVPERVMRDNYGTDDFLLLLERGGGDAVELEQGGQAVRIPATVFDNRIDQTSFLRADPTEWEAEAVAVLHSGLTEAFAALR